MLTAETLRRCSFLDTISLETILRRFYPKDTLIRSEFLGLSNGEQFVYKVAVPDEDEKSGMRATKVYVWQGSNGELVADY